MSCVCSTLILKPSALSSSSVFSVNRLVSTEDSLKLSNVMLHLLSVRKFFVLMRTAVNITSSDQAGFM